MSKPNTIQRFTHNHPLTEVNVAGTYTCNGCKLQGHGKTYRCKDCDYDLHEYCATCPPTLVNTWHAPGHELTLFTGPAHMTERLCYFCRFYIQGMFYKCKNCNFESHPLCTHGLMHVSPAPDATITKSRSLHDHAAQPSSPHHYGQGYSHMSPPYPYAHQQQQVMNHGSPKADRDSSSRSTKKKGSTFGGKFKTAAGATLSIVAQVALGTAAGSLYEEYEQP
ncbi:unnamed protein product [Eruca vesicaria subsp. sativa]|uniref:DC1 domain-containing protein n=1 Tax=Eruca vesicaria subsp. sativa TaxID=29727 RepID=A0ABC8M8F4_ERUVS|nr:unnamed protein product [Eruca vesicaria subsp. sativa]